MFESEEVKLAREALNQSREELRRAKASYKELKKYYRVSKINAGKSFVTRVHNSIINYFKEQVKEQLQEQERVANRKADMKAALRENNKEKIKTRFLNIKSRFASKIQVAKSYIGEIKNRVIAQALLNQQDMEEKEISVDYKQIVEEMLEKQRKKEQARRKADMKAALRENDKEKIKARFLNIRSGFVSKIQIVRSYIGEVKNNFLENALMYGNNMDKVAREATDKFKIFGLTKTYQMKLTLDEIRERYRRYRENCQVQAELKQIEKENEREKLKAQQIEEEVERLLEQQRKEELARRKADMKAALRENDKEKIKARFLNIKSGFASKIQVTKSYMGELKNKALENAVIYGKNIDKVTRELVDKGKIFGLTKTYQIKQNVDNAKERYNSYKINRMVKSELKRIAKEETKEEERSQKRREEIERLSEEKRKLERAQNKKAMIYALNQRDREEFDKRHLESLQQIEELKKAIFNKNSSSRSR